MNRNSVCVTPEVEQPKGETRTTRVLQTVLLTVLTLTIYGGVLVDLAGDWWSDANASHGFIVPVVSAWLIWRNRVRLVRLVPSHSWTGWVFIAGAVLMLVTGVLGTEFFLTRASLVVLVGGEIVVFLGWQYFRALLFPWALLFLMVPVPSILLNQVTMPLQLLASDVAGSLLPLLGVPLLRDGNIIQLPVVTLEVADACSGIRSLLPLATLSLIFGYVVENTMWRRIALIVAAIPISILANSLRITGTGVLAQYWDPVKALGFFHLFAGWCVFLVSVGLLYSLHLLLHVGRGRNAG